VPSAPTAHVEWAPAKVNLTLRVRGRRPDGYHELESLVVFAAVGDVLTFTPAKNLALAVRGPTAAAAGDLAENLVLKAARALAERIEGLKVGRFALSKRLPVAAGLGGGSTDAAAALRLLARHNRIALDDARLVAAARATGADVPVCLDPQPRVMCGIGERLSAPLALPRLPALLINPRVSVATKDVFTALGAPPVGEDQPASLLEELAGGSKIKQVPARDELIAFISRHHNDLEAPAVALHPAIAQALAALRALPGCRLARMSGSGASCFGLFDSNRTATAAARALRLKQPQWWIRPTVLRGQPSVLRNPRSGQGRLG
jgi:4-diphosphocytidyl-2-C-methyl-D-erythritol kinase